MSGVDVTGIRDEKQILREVASWSTQDIERLYFSDDGDGAVAIIVYFTVDEFGQPVTGTGAVVFPGGAEFVTGDNPDKIGIWLFPLPETGVFVHDALVKYIKIL